MVPAGVSSIEVLAAGADEESSGADYVGLEGKGAQVSGELNVARRQTLYVEVGRPESGEASGMRTSPRSFSLIPDDRLIIAGAGGRAAQGATFESSEKETEAADASNAGEGGQREEGFQGTPGQNGDPGTQDSGGAGSEGVKQREESFGPPAANKESNKRRGSAHL